MKESQNIEWKEIWKDEYLKWVCGFANATGGKIINGKNNKGELEKEALKEFEKGKQEVYKKLKNKKFFYMAPLKVKKPCLKCHKAQNYKIGDIIGCISVYITYKSSIPYTSLLTGHIAIGLIVLLLIIVYNRKLFNAFEKIKHQAIHDGLTGVFNRVELQRRFKEELNRAKRIGYPLSVVMCDVDYFKKYNDTYGH